MIIKIDVEIDYLLLVYLKGIHDIYELCQASTGVYMNNYRLCEDAT